MKRFLLILGLLFIIVFNSSNVGIEPYTNNNTTIILLGDSMLKNNLYVKPGFAVDDLLRNKCLLNTNTNTHNNKNKNITIVNYAREDAQIADVYTQLTRIDNSNNNNNDSSVSVFLSIGGNNILQVPMYQGTGKVTAADVNTIFEKYKNLIDAIKTKLPNCKLFLLNIYHTYDATYAKLNPMIDLWNKLLNNYFYNDSAHLISGIVDVKTALNQPSDLTFKIEPSERGGEKITDKIIALTI
uniref:SGNH hydrolase-type esterase domain-containing protein n=1 Tax=viral metagenome TaxID=1070528 RepID=A0A6C0HH56_9ZZZZ